MHKKLLPDTFEKNLEIIFCGMAAGELSARVGGYYANKNNKFWNVLNEVEFTDKIIKSCNYKEVLEYNLGLTDLVKNQSGVDSKINFRKKDISILEQKIYQWKPNILAFNGKKPASTFLSKSKKKISWGEQAKKYGKTKIWVLPSTSGLNGMWDRYKHKEKWKNLYQQIKNK